MNKSEVAGVLATLKQFQYVEADVMAVESWASALDGDMPARFAVDFITKWYAELRDEKTGVLPGHINKAWRDHRKHTQPSLPSLAQQRDAHCGRHDCRCTHSGACYRGWLDNDEGVASPCPNCRNQLWELLQLMPPPGERTEADTAVLRSKTARAGDGYREAV